MRFYPVSLRHGYYLVSFINIVFSPQCRLWLLRNSILNRVLCHLYWIRILDIFKFVQRSTTILPLDAELPSFSCIFLCLVPLLVMKNTSFCNVFVPSVLVLMMDLIGTICFLLDQLV